MYRDWCDVKFDALYSKWLVFLDNMPSEFGYLARPSKHETWRDGSPTYIPTASRKLLCNQVRKWPLDLWTDQTKIQSRNTLRNSPLNVNADTYISIWSWILPPSVHPNFQPSKSADLINIIGMTCLWDHLTRSWLRHEVRWVSPRQFK